MAVDRIIFLLAIIRVAENAPHSVGSMRDGFRYHFVLNSDVNDFNASTDSMGSTESALTARTAPEDFSEFEKKSASSDVTKSTSLHTGNQHHSGSTREGFKWKYQFVLNSDVNDFNASEDFSELRKKSASSDVTKSLEPIVSSIARISRSSGTTAVPTAKRRKTKQKSPGESVAKFGKGESRGASRENKKSTKGDESRRNAGQKQKASIPFHASSTEEPWNMLMIMAAKSLTKSDEASTRTNLAKDAKNSVATGKSFASARRVDGRKTIASKKKKNSSKQESRPATKNLRKSSNQRQKPKSSVATQKGKSVSKPTKQIASKNPQKHRDRRDTEFTGGPEAKYVSNNFRDTRRSAENGRKRVDGRKKFASKRKKKKNSSKQENRPATKNPRKSFNQRQKPKSSVATQKGKSFSMPTKRISSKNRQKNRDRRDATEFTVEPGRKCGSNKVRDVRRSVGNSAKQDFTFNIPMACTVIKISSTCDTDCAGESLPVTSVTKATQNIPSEPEEPQPPSQPEIIENPEDVLGKPKDQPPAELLPNEKEEIGNMPDKTPVVYDSGMEGDPSEGYEEYRDSELSDETHPASSPPEESPYVPPPEYQDPTNPPSDVNSPVTSTIVQPDARPKDPTLPKGQLRQYDGYGSPWWNPFNPRPPFVSSSATSRPIETLEHPVTPKNPFLTPTGSVNPWIRPPETPGGVFNVSAEADDDYDDYEDDEEDYDDNFDDDDDEGNKLDAKVEGPVENLAQTKPENESREVSLNSQMNDDDQASKEDDDYGDEDYHYNDEDYDEDYDNEEDYTEEAGNTGISDEDDYDLDED